MKDLNEVGFKIELETVPVAAYFADNILNGNFDMATFTWEGTAFPISSGSNLFYPADSEQNYSKISSDEIGEKFKARQRRSMRKRPVSWPTKAMRRSSSSSR